MDPDGIVIPEGFPQGIDAHDPQHGGIQGVDALVRRIGGMGGLPHILDGLADESVAAGADGHHRSGGPFLGMDHHGHVDVIEFPFVDQFSFPVEEMELPFLPEFFPVGDLDIFLRRHPEEHHVPAQVLHDPGFGQSVGRCQHGGLLHVMAAGMGGPGIRIRFGVFRTADGIQFSQNGDGGTGLAPFQYPFDGGNGHPFPIGDSQFVELGRQFGRCFEFLEPEFRFRGHIRSIGLEFLGRIINHPEHFFLHCFRIRNLHSPNEKLLYALIILSFLLFIN